MASCAMAELRDRLKEARRLADADPDESAPYQHLYQAAEMLEDLEKKLVAQGKADGDGAASAAAASAAAIVRRLRLERGLLLLQTDLLTDGEALVSKAVDAADAAAAPLPLLAALRARNALGALWCDRGDAERAKRHLEAAEALFLAAPRGGSSGGSGESSSTSGGDAPADTAATQLAAVRLDGGGADGSGSTAGGGAAGGDAEDVWAAAWDPADAADAAADAHTQTREPLGLVHAVVQREGETERGSSSCLDQQEHGPSRTNRVQICTALLHLLLLLPLPPLLHNDEPKKQSSSSRSCTA